MITHYEQGSPEYPLISLIHGRGLTGDYWYPLQTHLAEYGFGSVAFNLPVEDGQYNFNDLANMVAMFELQTRSERVVRLGHSWGCNPAVRAVTEQVVGIDFVSPVFHVSSVPKQFRRDLPQTPLEKHSLTHAMMSGDETRFQDPELRRYVFFNDVSPDITEKYDVWRAHPVVAQEPGVRVWPDVVMRFFALSMDHSVPKVIQQKEARAIGINPDPEAQDSRYIEIESGHMPMLSKTAELAGQIVEPYLGIT